MPATIAETLKQAGERLRAAQVPNDLLDAQSLLAEALGQDRTYLIVNFNQQLDDELLTNYQALIERRAAGEPLQYITGRQEFFGLDFEVTPAVLIPRPETELIIEETIRLAQQHNLDQPVIVDVGTGSGCIAVTLAREIEDAQVFACDISPAALRVAERNAARHNLQCRVQFIESDLLAAFEENHFADFILSNPPYVAAHELATLQREVRDWEPHLALTDRNDGLSFYRRLLHEAPARLKPGGYLICELGFGQSEAVTTMIDSAMWQAPRLLDDLQSIPRTLVLRKN
ncbi:MAG TPA: peptide chain release factor N(5)-glutamine methyltransferase [Blastocatellia bacterium]|nr:peptide chain release factor N(5)-glutamine methyltransferase [Blastocatellia bacterium]HMY76936.1 peptide chain release factor N(5)-glutamine methyltransferase [Blastocatellia bacterium]HMZ18975.1 peptide chain release factor N(5)-glutamine methyltransferase [Blastocatellia bacterium]HNG32470.1 peptide chain release factor N(5)-glutamine methyltransferase [Blastocatellia bacterium]